MTMRLAKRCCWTALVLSATGCDHQAANPTPMPATATRSERPQLQAFEITSAAGTYVVAVSPVPKDIPSNELFSMTVRVLNATDASPAKDVALAVDAAMPAHHHGMTTRPKISANPDGSFTVNGMQLHMSGDWEIYFDVTRGGNTERAVMSVTLE